MFLTVMPLLVFDLDDSLRRMDIHCVLRIGFEKKVHITFEMGPRMAYWRAMGLSFRIFAGFYENAISFSGDRLLSMSAISIGCRWCFNILFTLDLIALIPSFYSQQPGLVGLYR